jgi:hypothetical protein
MRKVKLPQLLGIVVGKAGSTFLFWLTALGEVRLPPNGHGETLKYSRHVEWWTACELRLKWSFGLLIFLMHLELVVQFPYLYWL